MTKRRTPAVTGQYDPSAPRLSKREQLRQQRRRRAMIFNVAILGTAALFLALVAVFFTINRRPGPLPGETVVPDEGAAVYPPGTELTYDHYPPSSGDRYQAPANWGVHTEPVPEGNYVTNLYQGGVVFLYQCPGDDCTGPAAQFQRLIENAPADAASNVVKIVAAPYSRELEAPIVALAWGHQLNLQEFDEDTLLRWYRRFLNQAPGG